MSFLVKGVVGLIIAVIGAKGRILYVDGLLDENDHDDGNADDDAMYFL